MFRSTRSSEPTSPSSSTFASAKRGVYTFSDLSQGILVVNRWGGIERSSSRELRGRSGAWGGTQHGHHLLDGSMLLFANTARDTHSHVIEHTFDEQGFVRYDAGLEIRRYGCRP